MIDFVIEMGEGVSRQGRGRARGRNSVGHRLSNPGEEGVREDEDIREEVDEEDEEGLIPDSIPVGSDSDDDDDEEKGWGMRRRRERKRRMKISDKDSSDFDPFLLKM